MGWAWGLVALVILAMLDGSWFLAGGLALAAIGFFILAD